MRHSLILLVASLFFIFGCAEDSSLVNPTSQSSDLEIISFESSSIAKKSKNNSDEGIFEKKFGKKGGILEFEVDGDISIVGELEVPKGEIKKGKVNITVDLSGEVGTIEFGPDGMEFDMGLEFSITFVGLDLSEYNSENLKFAYIAKDGTIEVIESAEITINGDTLNTKVILDHFSRYSYVQR